MPARDKIRKLIEEYYKQYNLAEDEARGKREEAGDMKTRLRRQFMNALPTLFGMGVGAVRGATFGPGPAGSIIGRFPDETKTIDPQTLGEVMLLPEHQSGPTVQQHELGHVAQGGYAGPLLPAASAITSGALQLAGRDPYLESPFETSAMEMGKAEAAGESTEPAAREALRELFLRRRQQ